jgi:hypothetical protein
MKLSHITKIPIATIKDFLPKGATRPFVACSDSGKQYVVKALKEPLGNGKLLLNEFVAGTLANQIDLPWPKTHLATLSNRAIEWLEDNSFEVAAKDCVAMDFVGGLIEVPFPKLLTFPKRDIAALLQEANPTHLAGYINNPSAQNAFYGRALFELWLFFEDTKSDTLYAKSDKTLIFLDGSHAFGGEESLFDKLTYTANTCFPQSPYLEGVLTNSDSFNEWLSRIESVDDIFVRSMIEVIPHSWGISSQQLEYLYELLTVKKERFMTVARQIIEWEAYKKNIL